MSIFMSGNQSSWVSTKVFDHDCKPAEISARRASLRQLFARDADAVTILDGHHNAQQNQRRERNDRVQRLVRGTTADGQGRTLVGSGANDQLAQFVDCLGRSYGLTLPVIWTSAGPFSILTGAGETGSASGKKRSSL